LRAAAALLLIPAVGFAQAEPAPNPQAPVAATTPAEETVAAAPSKRKAEEEITVTGSRVRRKDLTTPAPVSVVTREQIASSGVANIGDFLQQQPEQTGALNTNVNNGGDGQTQINLRNLGAQRTLVLVDGKRWVNGGSGAGTAVDLNTIPIGAIERIEILKDGASAVYGSDAIGGVVNIITRRRPSGTELSGYLGSTPHGDGQQYDLNLTTGVTSDKGSFLFNVDYFRQEALFAGNRDWAKTALNYDYGTATVSPGGSGTIPSGRATLDPSDPNCSSSLCRALLAAYGPGSRVFINNGINKGDPVVVDPGGSGSWRRMIRSGPNNDLYNYQAVNYLITPSTRISLFANGDYRITDFARVYVQASFNNRQSSYLIAPEPLVIGNFNATISPNAAFPPPAVNQYGNPYNPFGNLAVLDARRRLVELSGRTNGFDLDTVRVVTGIDGSLPSEAGPLEGLFYDVSFNYGRTSGVTTTGGSLNTQMTANALQGPFYQISPGVYGCGTAANPIPNCVPVNLFSGRGPINQDMATALGSYKGINQGFTQVAIVQANVSKELITLFSDRPVGVAAGYEHRREYGGNNPNPIAVAGLDTDFNSQPTLGSFNVDEGYGELNVPVINNVLGADELEVQGAVRVFKYSTFGSDKTYKVGGRWRPIRDVTFRGTYSTAFRAPNVSDLYLGQLPNAEVAIDPCAGPIDVNDPKNKKIVDQCRATGAKALNNGDTSTQLNSTVGGNPQLKPETAKIGTVGVVFEPTFVRGLSLTVDYWTVSLAQDIGTITTPVILAGCYPAASANAAAAGAPQNMAYCNLVQRSATTGQISNVFDTNQNVGSLWTSGIDLSARYFVPTDFGRFGFLFDSTYLLRYNLTLASGQVIKAVGNYDAGTGLTTGGLTPRIKFNAGVNYALEGFRAGVNGRYIGGFDECAGSDGTNASSGLCSDPQGFAPHRVKAYMTFDVFLSYLLRSPVGNTTFAVGVRNIADKTPPLVYNSFLTYADPQYDFAGRFVYGRITQQF
jgi:outer membrane receptor protein involved in Fe transport